MIYFMKKTVLFLCATAFCAAVNAQIVSSRSVSVNRMDKPAPSEKTWTYYVGVGTNTFTGDYEGDSKFGWQTGFEFSKPMGNLGACWGMGFAVGTRGYKFEEGDYEENLTAYNLQWSPFTFGWNVALNNRLTLKPHVGVYVSGDFAGNYKYEEWGYDEDGSIYDIDDYRYFDWGMNYGVGLSFDKKYSIDLLLQKGFLPNIDDDDISGGAFNFLVRFGIAL